MQRRPERNALPVECPDEQRGEVPAGIHRLWSAVSRPCAQPGEPHRPHRIVRIGQRDRSEPHERPVAGGLRRGIPGVGLAGPLESLQRRPSRVPDVEAPPRARPLSLAVPPHIPLQLIQRIEPRPLHQALAETQRHRRVVGPRTGREAERPTTDHVRDPLERPRPPELDRRPDCVTNSEPQERAADTLPEGAAAVNSRRGSKQRHAVVDDAMTSAPRVAMPLAGCGSPEC